MKFVTAEMRAGQPSIRHKAIQVLAGLCAGALTEADVGWGATGGFSGSFRQIRGADCASCHHTACKGYSINDPTVRYKVLCPLDFTAELRDSAIFQQSVDKIPTAVGDISNSR